VERGDAEAIYDRGRDVVVEVLLALSAQNARLEAQVEKLTARVARQDERIAQLERTVKRSSRNSSQPPSSDPPGKAQKRSKDPSGRKQGAQRGHEGKGRPLLPAWAVDEVVEHWPAGCGCGHVFAETERVSAGQPARHQVEELPVMAVTVIEHQCQRVRCPGCAATVTGVLPSEVASSAFGPRLQAAIVTLSVRNRISRRDVVELCEQLFSSRISTGTIDKILTTAGDALGGPYADLLDQVRGAGALNMDETGWRLKGAQCALWGAFTERHAVFAIASSLDAAGVERLADHADQRHLSWAILVSLRGVTGADNDEIIAAHQAFRDAFTRKRCGIILLDQSELMALRSARHLI
jgi:transposase